MTAPDPGLRERLRALVRTRGGRAVIVGLAATGLGCAFVPLADHLGFELAMALTVAGALLAPAAGVAAMRLELARPSPRPARAASAAMVLSVAALGPPVILLLLNALRRPACDAPGGALWLLLLPVPGLLLAASLGALARVRAGSARGALWRIAGIQAISIGLGAWTLYGGPAFFVLDHFFGYLPGPLYDETVLVSAPLLTFRALTVAWALVAVLACAGSGPAPDRRAGFGALALAAGLLALGIVAGPGLGHRTTDASLAEALGGTRTIDRLELHYPREWDDDTVERLARDAAFRASQVERALGVRPDRPVRVWMYRNTEEKRRLVGAATTSFAKPWRREVHVHASGFPHPVLRHELVHAFAGELGPAPFGTPGGLFPNSALIEGFAMAYDVESDGLTLTQWAKAMRDLKLAPDLSALLSTAGFIAAAPGRAYTYAGAFLRFLEATHGRDRVLTLYRTGDLAALGDPGKLVAAFEATLDATTVDAESRAAAERRYQRPSVFRRNCAREVSALAEKARRHLARGEDAKALETWTTACAMEPDDPALLKQLLGAAHEAGDTARAAEVATKLLAHPKLDPSLRAGTLLDLGDAAWRAGRLDEAGRRFAEAAQIPVDPNTHRAAVARVRAVADPARAALLRPLLVEGKAELGLLFAMNDHLAGQPDDALVAYLLGRQLVQRQAIGRGLLLLHWADEAGLGDAELARETLRLMIRGHAERHECDAAEALRARTEQAGNRADAAVAADWVERCRFETARGWPVL